VARRGSLNGSTRLNAARRDLLDSSDGLFDGSTWLADGST